jgi:aminoglycoside 2''-phosphotransferase
MPAEMILDDYRKWLQTQIPQIVAPGAALLWIDSGWDSRVLEVNGQWIFRFARRPEIVRQFRKELQVLPELADHLPAAIPNLEFVRLDDPNFFCIGYRKLIGEALSRKTATQDVAAQIGTFLHSLHEFPWDAGSRLGLEIFKPDTWRAEYLDFYQWVQENVLPEVSWEIGKMARNLWETFLNSEANFQFDPALIHGDLGEEHILIDPVSNRLVGVIDWGDTRIGDPALDFTGLLASCGPDFVRQALETYARPVDGRFWERMLFYQDILPFHQMLYGRKIGEESSFLEGLRDFESSHNKKEMDPN